MKTKKFILTAKADEPLEVDHEIKIAVSDRIKALLNNVYDYYASGEIEQAKRTCDTIKHLMTFKIKAELKEVEE